MSDLTDQMRYTWAYYSTGERPSRPTADERAAEFDRWLTQIKSAVWTEAVDHLEPVLGSITKRGAHADNPYRP